MEALDQHASCGCDTVRKAAGVDPEIKERNLKHLRRIEGQVRGLQKMVEEERYCADVLTQIASVHEALRGVARELMRNHLKHCATQAILRGPEFRAATRSVTVGRRLRLKSPPPAWR